MDKTKVLIVDDMQSNRMVMAEILRDLDIEIVMATSGEEALEQVKQHEFAVILLDVEMPGMDGYETAKHIAMEENYPPIIFVTATQQDKVHIDKGYSEGAIDYLLKPLDETIVRSKVRAFITMFEQRKALEESNEKLANFASMVCHDGKAPLNHIMVYIHFCLMEDGFKIPEEAKDYLQRAYDNCERMSQFYDDLYKFTKAKGKIEEKVPVNVEETVKEVKDLLADKIDASSATVTTEGINEYIDTGKTELSLIFQNLIANALKFTTPSGSPHIHITGVQSDNKKYEIYVTDNGIGIDEEDFEKCFKPFKRLNPSHKYPGTGLGLSTCSKLAEYLGGSIQVSHNQSASNKSTFKPHSGVTFVITLPHSTASY